MAMFGGKSASVSAAKETPASWVTRGLAKGYGMFGMTEQEAWRRAQQLSTALQTVTPLGVAEAAWQDTQNLMAGRQRDPLGVALSAIPGAPAAKSGAQVIAKAVKSGKVANSVNGLTLAKQRALPMDEASRMARADAMGFDVDAFHGTTARDFSSFSLGKAGKTGETLGRGVYVTPLPALASRFAEGDGGRVLPLKVNAGRQLSFTKEGVISALDDLPDFIAASRKADGMPELPRETLERWAANEKTRIAEAFNDGPAVGYGALGDFLERHDNFVRSRFDSIAERDQMVVFDPSRIRSRFAAFDPAKRNSANIMAGVGGFGLLGAGFMPRDEQPQTGKVY